MRIFLASSLLSPFQLELAEAINQLGGIEYLASFTMPFRQARGRHWQTSVPHALRDKIFVAPGALEPAETARWTTAQLDKANPEVVVAGALKGPIHEAASAWARRHRAPLGYWLEPPDPRRTYLYRVLVERAVAARLAEARFVLAIGDRAEAYYGKHSPNVALVPYGEDLAHCFAISRPEPRVGPLRFLFSGQLLPRQNVGLIGEAAAELLRRRGPTFSLCIAGHGPEQAVLDRQLARTPALGAVLEYDRDYHQWEDRLRPFARSDVLVYPSSHSGWGLVIPEAMAAGLTVISTRQVEAARFFVRHRVSGIFIEPVIGALVRELEGCLDRPRDVAELGRRAREAARDGDACSVARRFVDAVGRFV